MTQQEIKKNYYQIEILGLNSTLDIEYIHKIIIEQIQYLKRKGVILNEKEVYLSTYNNTTKQFRAGIESI